MFMQGLSNSPLPSHLIQQEIQEILTSRSAGATTAENEDKSRLINHTAATHVSLAPKIRHNNMTSAVPLVHPQPPHQLQSQSQSQEEVTLSSEPLLSETDHHQTIISSLPKEGDGLHSSSIQSTQQQPLPPSSQMPSTRFQRAHYS
jgi:hypothetical protein